MQKRYRRYTDAVRHIGKVFAGSTSCPTILPLLRTFPNLCSIRTYSDQHIGWRTRTDTGSTTAVSTINCHVLEPLWTAEVVVIKAFLPVEWTLLWRPFKMRITEATALSARKALLAYGVSPSRLHLRALDTETLEGILNIASTLAGGKASCLVVEEPNPDWREGHWESPHTLAYLDRASSFTGHLGADASCEHSSDIRRLHVLATRVRTLRVRSTVWPVPRRRNDVALGDPIPASTNSKAKLEIVYCHFVLRLDDATESALRGAIKDVYSDRDWFVELAKTLLWTFGPGPVIFVQLRAYVRHTFTALHERNSLSDHPDLRAYERQWTERIRETIKALASEHQHAQSPGWRRHRKGVALV